MTHTNFKRMKGLPQLSKTGNKFIRSKGRIFLLEDQPRKEEPLKKGKKLHSAGSPDSPEDLAS